MSIATALFIFDLIPKILFHSSYPVFTFGVCGNLLIIFIFQSLKTFRQYPCAFYFTSEAIANIVQLILFFLVNILSALNGFDPGIYSLFWCKFRSPMIVTCTITAFSTVCFSAFDQYLTTNYQVHLRAMSTIKLAQRLVLIAIICSISISISFAVFFTIQSTTCTVVDIHMSQFISYFYYPFLMVLVPIFFASLFSILAYHNVRKIVRRRLDRQLTAMVLLRVIIFVILTLPFGVQRTCFYLIKVNPSDLLSYAIYNLIGVIVAVVFNLNYAVGLYSE